MQWAYSFSHSSGYQTTNKSYVVLAAAEEWKYGGGTGSGADPYLIVMGGSSSGNVGSWGLLAYSMFAEFLTLDGVSSGACANCDAIVSFGYETIKKASNDAFFQNTDTQIVKTGMLVSNHCWTAVIGRPDATDTARAAVGGIIGTVNGCVKIAVDGYSLAGAMCIGIIGKDL